jgi:hypothetical protein
MVTPSAVVRVNTRVAVPRSVPEEPVATPGQIWGAASPETDGDDVRFVPGASPPRTGDPDPDAGAANGPGDAAASPK